MVNSRRSGPLIPATYHVPPFLRATTANFPISPCRKRVSSNEAGSPRQKSSAGSFSGIWSGRPYQKRNCHPLV